MRSRFTLAAVFVASLGLAWGGEPVEGPKPKPEPQPVKPAPPKPGEIVVTASRLPTDIKKVGSSVSVVSGEEFRLSRPTDTWEQLRFTPGVTFVRSGAGGTKTSLFMRGGESDHTVLLLDGFKVNDDGGGFAWETLHPAGIGRVEILRGAGTPLFGADALTGVIQVITGKGSGDPRAEFSFEAGTWSTTREQARLVGADGPVAYNLTLSRFDLTDGRIANSDYRSTTFAGRIDFDMPSGLHAKLVTHVMSDESGNYTTDATPDPNSRVEHSQQLIGLELSGRIADLVDSRLKLGRVFNDYLFEDSIDANDTSNFRNHRQLERLTVDWQNDAKIYEWGPAVGTLTVGVAWEEESGRIDVRGTGAADSENHVDRSRSSRSLYLHKRLELWEALTIDGGVRVEDHTTYGTKASSRVSAALWIERTGTRLHGSWGQGIKNPTFNENFDASLFDLGGFVTFTQGNADLDPERIKSLDLGIEQRLFDERLILGVTVFRNEFSDFINFEFAMPTSTYVNAGKAKAQGAEFELSVKPVDWVSLKGSLTVLHSEAKTDNSQPNFADGKPLLRRPEMTYGLQLQAQPFKPVAGAPAWTRKLTLFTEVFYESGATDVDWDAFQRVKLASFTLVNAGFNWEVLEGLRLFARVDNVFGEEYEQVVGLRGGRNSVRAGIGYTVRF